MKRSVKIMFIFFTFTHTSDVNDKVIINKIDTLQNTRTE